MAKQQSKCFIGIDVSKQQLEVAVHESAGQFRCANKVPAFGQLIVELIERRPALIVLEATGGLEVPVVSALQAAGLPVVVVNPRRVRDFARALGQLASKKSISHPWFRSSVTMSTSIVTPSRSNWTSSSIRLSSRENPY